MVWCVLRGMWAGLLSTTFPVSKLSHVLASVYGYDSRRRARVPEGYPCVPRGRLRRSNSAARHIVMPPTGGQLSLERLVEDAVAAQIQTCDPKQLLDGSDFQDVLDHVTAKVLGVMNKDQRTKLDCEDSDFIMRRVRKMVDECHAEYDSRRAAKAHFLKFDRVVCNVGRERQWAAGTIQSVNEDDPIDPDGPKLPYVVKIDPPDARLISVPRDEYEVCRAEVCFGQRADALFFTLFCLPLRKDRRKLRFGVGERVVCAVEDESNDWTVWRTGTVLDVDFSIEDEAKAVFPTRDWSGEAGRVPYRVQLDGSVCVLVHRDEHWLIRDLALQPEGPRQAADGTRALKRLEKRPKSDGADEWEAIDHMTRQVRSIAIPDSDED